MSSEKGIDMKWFEGGKQSDYKKRTRNGIEDLEIGDLKKNRNQLKIDYEKNEGRQEQCPNEGTHLLCRYPILNI